MRASFKPSAYLIGTETRPTSIVLYGLTGGAEKWLRIPLDLSRPPVTYPRQALAFAKTMRKVPFHGNCTGFVTNFTQVYAVVFDVEGNPVGILSEPYVPGVVHVEIGGNKLSGNRIGQMLSVDA